MQEAVSFATVLQLPEAEWHDLVLQLQLPPVPAARTHA
jgi:hypothetical protein